MDSPLDVVVKTMRLSQAVIGQALRFPGNRTPAIFDLAMRAWTQVATFERINKLAVEPGLTPQPRQILAQLEDLALDRIAKSFDEHGDNIELISNAQSLLSGSLDEVLRHG